jgi:histidyl-tRNA synthetase
VSDGLGAQGTVCAGGRYDGLLEQIGGKPAPACGFAIGIERLLALAADTGGRASPDVYLVNQGERAERFAFRVAEALRGAGFSVVQHCGSGSFKSQMRKADDSGAPVAVIVGDDEAQAGEAAVKALREEREQIRVPLERVPDAVANLLFGDDEGNS